MNDDKLTDDLLTIVCMYPGWITRREILTALDMTPFYLHDKVIRRLRKLEACGMIESQRCGKQWGGLWKYKATEKAWEG